MFECLFLLYFYRDAHLSRKVIRFSQVVLRSTGAGVTWRALRPAATYRMNLEQPVRRITSPRTSRTGPPFPPASHLITNTYQRHAIQTHCLNIIAYFYSSLCYYLLRSVKPINSKHAHQNWHTL